MADMKVSMVLTLLDKATPQLRKFVDALEGLNGLADTVNESLKALQDGFAGVSATLADATGPIRDWSTVARQAATANTRLADSAATLDGAVDSLNGTLASLGTALKGFDETIGSINGALLALSERMTTFAASAERADAAVETMGTVGAAALTETGDAAEVATAKMSGLHGTMKGLIELWGAWKIGEGLKHSVGLASETQQIQMMLKLRNISPHQMAAVQAGAHALTRNNTLLNYNQALEAQLAAQPGLPGQNQFSERMRQTLLPSVTREAIIAKMFGDKASMAHRVQNIFGIIESLGGAENLARARMILKDVRGGIIASHGKLDVRSIETALRSSNPGIRTNATSGEFQRWLALQEEMKAAGGGGAGGNTRIATLMNNIFMAANKGLMAKGAAVVMETLGLLNPNQVHKYGRSSYYAALNPGALKGAQMASGSPAEWAQKFLIPALTKFGELHWKKFGYKSNSAKDFANPVEIGKANAEAASYLASFRMGGQQFAGGLALLGNPSVMAAIDSQIKAQRQSTKVSSKSDIKDYTSTMAGQWKVLRTQLENVGIQIGTALLPTLTKLAHWATWAAHAVSTLNHNFPIFKKIEAWVGALGGLLLGIRGVEWLLGLQHGFFSLKTVMTGLTGAAKAMLPVLAQQISAFGQWKTLGAGMASLGIGYLFGKYVIDPIIHAIANFFHLPSIGGALARYFHPITTPINHVASLGAVVGQFNAVHAASHVGSPANALGRTMYTQAQQSHVEGGSIIARMGPGALGAKKGTVPHAAHPVVNHLLALAQSIYNQSLAITSPLGAKIAAVHQKYSGYAHQFLAAGMMGPYLQAQAVGHHAVLQLQYKQAMGHLSALKANLHNQLTGNAALVTAGAITKQQGAERAIALQKGIAPAMIAAADAAKKYAQALSDPKLVGALNAQIAKLQAMGRQLSYYQARVKQVTQGAFSGLINQMMHGQKTWGQMIIGFFQSIANGIDKTVSQGLSQAIAKALFPTGKKGQSAGGLTGIMNALGSLFSSSGSSGSSSHTSAGAHSQSGSSGLWSGLIQWAATHLKSFAVGTSNVPHDMVANIHKGEMIIPAAHAAAIRAGGGGSGATVNMHVHTIDSQSFLGHLSTVKRELATMVNSTNSAYNLKGA